MVNMGKRYAESDSEDNNNSSSDEDNGNFKRRRRRNSSDDEDFVQKTLQSFVVPEVSKPLKVVDSRVTQIQIQKQKVVNEKLSKLPKYDDLFDNTAPEVCPQKSSVSKSSDHLTVDTVDSVVDSDVRTKIEVTTDKIDVLASGDSKDVCKAIDPRLRRLEKFKPPPEPVVEPMPVHALMRRVNELLNARKPSEAYTQLKAEVTPLEIHKHVDLLMVMAKDWFPAQIDSAYDPRNVFIEPRNLTEFAKLLKDVFSTKVKSKEFWESVIYSVEKFIDESKIKELPQLLARLRWILVKDIRDYLMNEEVMISIKVSNILLDHKLKLENNRDARRRQFEARINESIAQMTTTVTAVQDVETEPSEPVPVIIGRPVIQHYPKSMSKSMPKSLPQSLPQSVPQFSKYEDQSLDQIQPKPAPIPHPFLTNGHQNEKRTISQILECLNNDQYFKLIQMLDRHTRNNTYTFIDNFGHALRSFIEKLPKFSVFTIYQKLHDTIYLNIHDFDSKGTDTNRIVVIFEKFLKEFHETVLFNPKEWLLIREHTRTEHCHFRVDNNPFNEQFVPILHNVVANCGYNSSSVKVNYTALEEEIPLMSQNIILKDPRMELLSEDYVKSHEVIHLDDSVVGNFSPIRSDSSSPNTSPEYSSSVEANHCSDSDANSDIVIVETDERADPLSSEPQIASEEISGEPSVQRTENANPIRKPLTHKVVKTGPKKVVPLKNKLNNKTILKKTVVKKRKLINGKIKTVNKSTNNLSKPQKSVIKLSGKPAPNKNESPVKPKTSISDINLTTNSKISTNSSTVATNNALIKTVNKSSNNLPKPQKNVIKLSGKSAPKTAFNKKESPVKPKTTTIVSDINSNTNLKVSTISSVATNNTVIVNNNSVPNPTDVPQKRMICLNKYKDPELKKIVRRVSISTSDDSSNED